MTEQLFFIVDIRRAWLGDPYVTLWRPRAAGYAWPLAWAGKYTLDQLQEAPGYYEKRDEDDRRRWAHFPVRCEDVEPLAIAPSPGRIDGDAGPVIPNNAAMRRRLLQMRFRLPMNLASDLVELERTAR